MNLDRAIAIQNQAISSIRDAYSTSRSLKSTAEVTSERVSNIFKALPKSTPRHVREFLRGYNHALNDALWSDVEFCYRDAEGVLYSTHRGSTHRSTEEFYSTGRGCELGNLECAHVWRGTDKPYTDWAISNAC